MIYFLDNSLQLQKIVTSKNVISAIHEHELNGLIRADVELDLSYANKFLILGIDHVGYYYKDEFYLHKIQRVEYDHVNESVKVVLRHIFFEDMIFGKLIRDVRPQNQDALAVSRQTIDANTRWQTVMTDVTGRLSTNFYWQVPYEVIEFMTENYRIEYLPKILFDGEKINGFQLHLANKVGEDKNIRIPYGSRVLDLKYEEDYSEIITKLVVHGKGEEVGSGYGRRINISDVDFSRNGVESPVGSLYLEDKSITNTYGNDGQTPREGREVFEDIEDPNELAEAGYQHYLQVSRPQMLFTADVADIGDVGIGDSVMIIRREYDVYFNARIHKLSVDLLYPEDAQVELGDYKHFKESKVERKTREKNNRVQGQLSDRITRLKREANEHFDNEVAQWRSEFEQAMIDAEAEVEAMRVTMTEEFETAQREFEEEFNQSVTEAKQHADDVADAKTKQVQDNLDSFAGRHEQIVEELQGRVIDVDGELAETIAYVSGEFNSIESQLTVQADGIRGVVADINSLGAQVSDLRLSSDNFSVTIGELEADLTEKINGVDTWHYNMLRGTRFDEGYWEGRNMEKVDDDINYFHFIPANNNAYSPNIQTTQEIQFNKDETYTLSFDFQTYAVRPINSLWIISNEEGIANQSIHPSTNHDEGNFERVYWNKDFRRYYVKFSPRIDISGFIRIGINFNLLDSYETHGRRDFKIRLPYLTTTNNTRWLYHQLDNNQNLEEATRRISKLEQTADSIDLLVAEINDTAVRQSEIFVGTSGIQIGATYVGDSQLASILSVSPRSIDVITDNMNLTGNLNVKGQIESISMSAVKADFADLFAARVRAGDVDIDNISGRNAWFERLYTLNANIDRLTSQFAFIEEVKALSITAVEANIGSIRSKILTSDVIQASHIKAGTTLIDKIFSSTAMFERMMSKSAFITTLNTVSIDTDQLTIRRPDGGVLISNGTQRFGSPIITKPFPESTGVTWDGINYVTTLRSAQSFERAYGEHSGRYANFSFRLGLRWDSAHASSYVRVVIRPGTTPSGVTIPTANEQFIVYRDRSESHTISVRMPVPTFGAVSWTLEFYRVGDNVSNYVQIRSERCWVSA